MKPGGSFVETHASSFISRGVAPRLRESRFPFRTPRVLLRPDLRGRPTLECGIRRPVPPRQETLNQICFHVSGPRDTGTDSRPSSDLHHGPGSNPDPVSNDGNFSGVPVFPVRCLSGFLCRVTFERLRNSRRVSSCGSPPVSRGERVRCQSLRIFSWNLSFPLFLGENVI